MTPTCFPTTRRTPGLGTRTGSRTRSLMPRTRPGWSSTLRAAGITPRASSSPAQPEDDPQPTAGWWQQLGADAEAVNYADADEPRAVSNTGDPWPPQRVPDMEPPSAPEPETRTSPEHEPAQENQAARLNEL